MGKTPELDDCVVEMSERAVNLQHRLTPKELRAGTGTRLASQAEREAREELQRLGLTEAFPEPKAPSGAPLPGPRALREQLARSRKAQ